MAVVVMWPTAQADAGACRSAALGDIWVEGHMTTTAMTLSSAAASSTAHGRAGTSGSHGISISVWAGAQLSGQGLLEVSPFYISGSVGLGLLSRSQACPVK